MPAREHDERHPDRDDEEDRDAREQVLDVRLREEVLLGQREEDEDADEQHEHDREAARRRPDARARGRRSRLPLRVDAPAPRVTGGLPRSARCVPRSPRRAKATATIRPRNMTSDAVAEQSAAPVSRRTRRGSPTPALGGSNQEPVDLRLRADVDAARRLVQQQHAGRVASHLPSTTFCWLPPDERRRPGRADEFARMPKPRERLVARRGARGAAAAAEPRQAATVDAMTRFSRTLMSRTRPCVLAIGGHERRRRCAIASRGMPERDLAPSTSTCLRSRRRSPNSALEQLAPAPLRRARRGRRSRRRPTSRSTSANAPGHGEPSHASAGRPRVAVPRLLGARRSSSSSRPTISRMSPAASSSAVGPSPTRAAVAEHRDAVGELEHLVDPVRDEDRRRRRRRGSVRTRREERLHLVVGERAGRLVEDQHARVDRERARDLDHLLQVGPQPADGQRRVERRAEPLERGARRLASSRQSISRPRSRHPVPEEDVLGDREVGRERRLLGHGRDAAGAARRSGSRKRRRPAVERIGRRRRDLAGEDPAAASTCRSRSRPRARAPRPG